MTRDEHTDELNFLGGHPALDFINSLRQQSGAALDIFQSDNDVVSWLDRTGIAQPALQQPLAPGALLQAARRLRSCALEAVQQRKLGQRLQPAELNNFLVQSSSHLLLRQHKEVIEVNRVYSAQSAEQFLAPLAEDLSDLLANGNFDLIRRCEGAGCVLWFLDQTKGHRRRWCSAKTCGTRARVAAFRTRQVRSQLKTGARA